MSSGVGARASRGVATGASRGDQTRASRGNSTRRQFAELAKTHARTVIRDRSAVIALLVSFVFFLALFGGLDLLIGQAVGVSPGLLRTTLGFVAVFSFLAVALGVTAVPRIACGVTGWALLQVAVTLALGAALLLGLGYLVAARIAKVELGRQLAFLIPILVLASSGAMFSLDAMPDALRSVLLVLPTTWFVTTLNAQLGLGTEMLDPVLAWLMVLAAAAGLGAAAANLFRWTPAE